MTDPRVAAAIRHVRRIPAYGVLLLIRSYQLVLSPMLPASCRYIPTCSAYAAEEGGMLRQVAGRLGVSTSW